DAILQDGRGSARAPGWVLVASAIAMIVLLALHPEGQAKDFAGVLRNEAADRRIDAIVHGGFVLILAIQMACYAIFSLRLAKAMNAAITGLVFFCFGAAMLSGSTLIDGLVLPSIAAKYAGVPAKIDSARTLYAFGGAMISILMPLGIGFQSAGITAWGWGLLRTKRRGAGIAGLSIGLLALVTTIAAAFTMNPMALMVGIAALALWAVVAGVTVIRSGT
ncbi:MAG TPA: hypothetical protein VGK90_09335, partial [Rhizomicrobium sp.]